MNKLLCLLLTISLANCASTETQDKCKLNLPPLSASYRASGATRLHDMRRLAAVNEARNFCQDGEIKIEEDRETLESERTACPKELSSTRLIRISCVKAEIKTAP